MNARLRTISPVDGRCYVERELADAAAINAALDAARRAQADWQRVPLASRVEVLGRAVQAFVANGRAIAEEITWQMGRPLRHAPSEIRGFEERARYMLGIAATALEPIDAGPKPGFARQIKRVPVGVVAVLAPWNYPYLTAVNSVLPALIAGNTVLLKHSHQTPLCAERFAEAFAAAGVPRGVFQFLHLSHEDTARLVADARVDAVCFTGSVAGGRAVVAASAAGFATSGLELGGKDPAYVRADADLRHAVESLTDGAFYNAGQSCCGIKRIYVIAELFERFVEALVELTHEYRLDSPLDAETTLGPLVRAAAADAVRAQIDDALSHGARALIDVRRFPMDRRGTPYLAPQVLVNIDHSHRIMREETFGPAIGIMKVASDEEAVRLMNDSAFGLTAAIYSADPVRAEALGDELETGTVFLNRCDYLDPALAWTGVKNSGRGCTLSRVGFEHSDASQVVSFQDQRMSTALRANWSYPTRIWAGPGRIAELGDACAQLRIRRPLIVTDRGLLQHPMLLSARTMLPGAALFGEVKGNPTGSNVEAGLAAYRGGAHDGVVAFGGGSALDTGKAVAFMSGQKRPMWDFEDVGDWWTRADPAGIAPVIAVPTTAGTGSEVGRAAVILNEATHEKKILFHPQMMPAIVISDPELTVGLPPNITAATGMDAFVHCFEAFCAPGFHPLADGLALEGMRLIARFLPQACADGRDIEARANMLAAASMGAAAFQKGLGAVHAIAHPVGSWFDTHHGLTNAVVLPYVMRHNRSAISEKSALIARLLGLKAPGYDALFDWVLELRRTLGIPHSLAEIGVDAGKTTVIGEQAARDPSAAGNPVPVDAATLERIFRAAVAGDLQAAH